VLCSGTATTLSHIYQPTIAYILVRVMPIHLIYSQALKQARLARCVTKMTQVVAFWNYSSSPSQPPRLAGQSGAVATPQLLRTVQPVGPLDDMSLSELIGNGTEFLDTEIDSIVAHDWHILSE